MPRNNSFISSLAEEQMSESILLQSRDYQGLGGYWLLHLPEHISQLR